MINLSLFPSPHSSSRPAVAHVNDPSLSPRLPHTLPLSSPPAPGRPRTNPSPLPTPTQTKTGYDFQYFLGTLTPVLDSLHGLAYYHVYTMALGFLQPCAFTTAQDR